MKGSFTINLVATIGILSVPAGQRLSCSDYNKGRFNEASLKDKKVGVANKNTFTSAPYPSPHGKSSWTNEGQLKPLPARFTPVSPLIIEGLPASRLIWETSSSSSTAALTASLARERELERQLETEQDKNREQASINRGLYIANTIILIVWMMIGIGWRSSWAMEKKNTVQMTLGIVLAGSAFTALFIALSNELPTWDKICIPLSAVIIGPAIALTIASHGHQQSRRRTPRPSVQDDEHENDRWLE